MKSHRVAVTGMGAICALGKAVPEIWSALAEGRSGIRPIQTLDCSCLKFRNGAEVPDYQISDYFGEKAAALLDRFAQFNVIAAREAVADAAIPWTPELRRRTAIVTGSSVGGQQSQDTGFSDVYLAKRNRVAPLTICRVMANAGASHISLEFGVTGPAFNISTACSSSNHAIGNAFWMVRQGLVDMAITGGAESPFSFGFLKAWEAMRVVSPDTCRPFSKDRRGMILGEGSAVLILEPLEAARARGAKIYGEIVGFGMSADAHHITQPSVEGPELAIRMALEDAGMDPSEVGYINAHGTGTLTNDPTEAAAIGRVFGGRADKIPLSSTKSMHGHALGGAGAIEAVATLLAMQNGIVPPTANFTELDPQCPLDVVANVARKVEVAAAISNSFAFGGLNAVLAFRRAE